MLYFPLNLWDKSKNSVGHQNVMNFARLHHLGPYSQEYAEDYTEDYPEGEPQDYYQVGTTGVTREEALPIIRFLVYTASIFGGGMMGYAATVDDKPGFTQQGRRRKRKKAIQGTVWGVVLGTLLGAGLDAYVVPHIKFAGITD